MKKNVMMRIACFLLVAVLISTSTISGTYAKYVTDGTGTDTARVAKFGVKVNPNGNLFLQWYGKDDGTFTLADNTVISSDTWKVVAPGTTHSLTEVQLEGQPEVAVRVNYKADLILGPWKDANGDDYCPIIFTVEGETYGMDFTTATNTYATVAALEAAVEGAIAAHTKDYVANTNLATIPVGDALSVTWAWPFETGADAAEIAANDIKDTFLGDQAAAGYHSMIQLTVTTTVTQIN